MSVTRQGQMITNGTAFEQLVTLRLGDRWMRLLLAPGESRTCGDMPEAAELTSSTDTSPARGRLTVEGGPSPGERENARRWKYGRPRG